MTTRRTKRLAWLGGIATAVVAGLIVEWTKDFPVLKFAGRALGSIWRWLLAPTTLSHWLLTLLILATVFFAGAFFLRLMAEAASPAERYVSDRFLDIDWQWSYSGGQIYADNMIPICPRCSLQMTFADASSFAVVPRTAVICEDCKYSQEFEGNVYSIQSRVIKLAQRNLRTGAYMNRLASPKAPRNEVF